ncbi:MAG: HAD family phosphatase [Patescibacteria group bacterium]
MIKALIFDFDGVIADGDQPRYLFLQQEFTKRGVILDPDMFPNTVGKATTTLFQTLFKDLNSEIKEEVLQSYETVYKSSIEERVVAYKETVEFIKEYSGNTIIALTTNRDKYPLLNLLKKYQIEKHFQVIITKDMVTLPKPDPQIYLLTVKTIGVKADECIAVEDSVIGARSAIDAGLNCYIFLNQYNTEEMFKELDVKGFIKTKSDYFRLTSNI